MINTESVTVMPFSPQEGARIMELQAEYGNQWTKIGGSLERHLPWQVVRHHFMTLKQMEANDGLSALPPEFTGISELEVPTSFADRKRHIPLQRMWNPVLKPKIAGRAR